VSRSRVRRVLGRPAVFVPALVLLSLAGGIGYAAYERVGTSAVEANARLLSGLPLFPGARELDRRSETSSAGDLPLPEGVLTTVLYGPPADASQEEVVDFYVSELEDWEAESRTVPLGDADEVAYRVDLSRGVDCVMLLTAGMAPGGTGERRTFALAAIAGEGPCA
jgi:hypothetical protein